ncbi:MAG TPA: hypothetical protein VNB90_00090 [Cytophagaceae bacterium]|nr:hypothetical protein [Cytophagaceae bacterium]
MAKIVRSTYPAAFSIGLLILIYAIIFFLSEQIFNIPISAFSENKSVYLGMFLVSTAVMIMILILWEEFLFPIKLREVNGGMIFHNHRNKLKTQLMIYFFIPVIFVFIYFNYQGQLNLIRFAIVAAICIILPLLEKLASGVKNYNDFLRLTNEEIEYKDNDLEGRYQVKDIQTVTIITHERAVTHQIELLFKDNSKVTIDLHDMELEEYYTAIHSYIYLHYRHMLKEVELED